MPEGRKAESVLDLTPHCGHWDGREWVEGFLNAKPLGCPSPTPSLWGTFRKSLDLPRAAVLAVLQLLAPWDCPRLQSLFCTETTFHTLVCSNAPGMHTLACQSLACCSASWWLSIGDMNPAQPSQPPAARPPCEHCTGSCVPCAHTRSLCIHGRKHCQFPELWLFSLLVTNITPTLVSHTVVVLASGGPRTNNRLPSPPLV